MEVVQALLPILRKSVSARYIYIFAQREPNEVIIDNDHQVINPSSKLFLIFSHNINGALNRIIGPLHILKCVMHFHQQAIAVTAHSKPSALITCIVSHI